MCIKSGAWLFAAVTPMGKLALSSCDKMATWREPRIEIAVSTDLKNTHKR